MKTFSIDFSQLENTYPRQESDALLSVIKQLIWLISDLQQDVKELKDKQQYE